MREVAVLRERRLHVGDSLQCSCVVLGSERLSVLSYLTRQVHEGDEDDYAAEELPQIRECLKIQMILSSSNGSGAQLPAPLSGRLETPDFVARGYLRSIRACGGRSAAAPC